MLFRSVSSNSNNTVSDRIAAELFNIVSEKTKVRIREEEPDYSNNPVVKRIYQAITEKGAKYFSEHSSEILKQGGFNGGDDMVLMSVGEQLEENKKWDEGIALYKVYAEQFPRIVVAWNRLGICYREKGDTQKARECWEKSVSIRPVNNRAVQWLKELK